MNAHIIFSDCKLQLDRVGTDELAYNVDAVISGVKLLLTTYPGTRTMLREYGCNLLDLLFEPATTGIGRVMAHRITQAIERWCPEVQVLNSAITVKANQADGTYRIDVPLTIPSLGVSNYPLSMTLYRR